MTLAAIGVMAVITFALRAAPFVVLSNVWDKPAFRTWARAMPPGIMVILTLYSVTVGGRDEVPLAAAPLGILVTVALYHWRRTVLIAVVGGTATYSALLQLLG